MIAEQLKTLRRASGLRSKELAEVIGIPRGRLSHYITGRTKPTKYASEVNAALLALNTLTMSHVLPLKRLSVDLGVSERKLLRAALKCDLAVHTCKHRGYLFYVVSTEDSSRLISYLSR